ncbi:hypothetical protein B4U79_08676 [Dinothrombium tinctorium]|uniref:Uncharacterized protein n=1 Tax=Dinothrombium tinctorium TaxID=1965070 RepID=A0A3S3PLV8_9ACAR|nr:hypothetical protein B4U79_08676 [Dinothrombium tinctorium]
MGNSNAKQHLVNRRPHSVLGVRNGDQKYFGFDDCDIRAKRNDEAKRLNQGAKAILPPLPRSHSFHHILRSTENGMNLLKKGTIRGIENKANNKNVVLGEEEILNPELNAILKNRRCKSETNLHLDEKLDSLPTSDEFCDRSVDSRGESPRKGFSNGVAARIQRAKYKAPLPPNSSANNSVPYGDNYNINKAEAKNFDNNLRGSKRSLKHQETKNVESKPKVGLIRRLSENSYISSRGRGKQSQDTKTDGDFVMIPRLRMASFERSRERNLVFDSRNERSKSNKVSKDDIRDASEKGNDKWNKAIRNSSGNLFEKRVLSDFDFKDDKFVTSQEMDKAKLTAPDKSSKLFAPPFDDNFILKRATPTAGLSSPSAGIALSSSPQRSNGSYTKYCSRQDASYELDRSNANENYQLFNANLSPFARANYNSPPHTNFMAKMNHSHRWKSDIYLLEEQNINANSGLTKLVNKNSYISDSANYSDEEEEEEIKVVLKPYLPPPRKPAFNAERVVITDDIFNVNTTIKRDKCWTPLEDLSSSDEEDDDGINCDQTSDDDEILKRGQDICEVLRDSSTRFTLQNQLRTLIHNNKMRHYYP